MVHFLQVEIWYTYQSSQFFLTYKHYPQEFGHKRLSAYRLCNSGELIGITMDDGPPQSFYFFVSFLEVVEIKICSSTFFYNFLEVVEATIN